jgi:hypothetical protein
VSSVRARWRAPAGERSCGGGVWVKHGHIDVADAVPEHVDGAACTCGSAAARREQHPQGHHVPRWSQVALAARVLTPRSITRRVLRDTMAPRGRRGRAPAAARTRAAYEGKAVILVS